MLPSLDLNRERLISCKDTYIAYKHCKYIGCLTIRGYKNTVLKTAL